MAREDTWAAGERYEPYVGRWSRAVAREFVSGLALPAGSDWLDVGCGTGALTRTMKVKGKRHLRIYRAKLKVSFKFEGS